MQRRSSAGGAGVGRNSIASASGGVGAARVHDGKTNYPAPRPEMVRSSLLRSAGSALARDPPATPEKSSVSATSSAGSSGAVASLGKTRSEPAPGVANEAEVADIALQQSLGPLLQPQEEQPCGLTPASLKHVRRQRDKLEEELTRMKPELAALKEQLREQRDRVATLETEALEFQARQVALRTEFEEKMAALCEDIREAEAREARERERAEGLEKRNIKLEESLATKEQEVSRLRQALEDQRLLTKEVCEAAEQRAQNSDRERELEERASRLQREKAALEHELKLKGEEHEEIAKKVAFAMVAAEKAMALGQQIEMIRAAKIADAINQKVELHISVPRVTLSYNNAPPLLVSVASGLGDKRINEFLDQEVFPHFEPLWARVDQLEEAPDGTSKKAYATRMLERLTEAVKGFIKKSQQADDLSGAGASDTSDACTLEPKASADGSMASGRMTTMGSPSVSKVPAVPARSGGRGGGDVVAESGGNSLSDGDRERLLTMLRSGDDRGLDSKLCELLEKRR